MQAGNDYYFHNSSSGAWPVLQSGGTPVVVGGVGAGWVPFGAVETATGFDVAWKNTTSGLYMVWQTDSNGNFVANAVGAVTGSNLTLEGLETTFNQDLNGDGTIGVPTTVIQTDTNAYGSITLLETGNEYYLHNSSGVGPVLQTGGAPVLAGSQGAGWIPFGAVETASGLDVAWKNATSGLYMVWQTDGSGNFVSNAVGAVTGGNLTLQALETTFNQDLNGDGTIGVAATVIQTDTNAYGSITLLESGNEYYLHNSSGAGPVLQVGGVPIMDGAAGPGWSPYGAVETATGYDVAWKNTVYGVYTEWQTDSNGNYVSDTIGAVTSTSPTLEALETTFNQDLNGDGTIGPPGTTVIQTDTNAYGSITLLEFGNDYLLHNSSGIGPTLELGGIPVVVGGEGAGWIPFGAVETASGFDVAWKNTVSGLYMVWQTDSNGNFVADAVSAAPGSNLTLEGLETTFNQDLNGDGTIGVPATVIQTDTNLYGSITLLESGNEYYLHNSSGAGPVLQSGGTPVTDGGEGAGWEPFGAVETATGYDVAWKNTVSGLYMVWQTDSSGNFVANAIGAVAGSNLTLEGLETTFNQDLNGDGTIGVPSIVIQTDTNSYGSTTLVESGNEYYLHNNSGIGPVLEVFGSPIMVGGAGPGWAPIGAAETATGYDVAWQNTVYGVYTVWQTDSSGNYVSDTLGAVTSSNSTLEALETTFNQDLNGDGTIGVPAGGSAVSSLSHATGTEAITISVGATVEVAADHAGSVTFEGSTGMLRLDDAPAFSSEIFNFSGDGTLSGSDQIDLRDINFNSVHDSYDNGVLTVSDGADTATLDFNGSYVLANFSFANDGSGGTIVYDPPVSNANTSPAPVGQTGGKGGEQAGALVVSSHDNFVFPSHLGSGPATDHVHDTNAAPLSQSELAHVTAIIAAIHDDSHAGSAPDMMASAHSAVDHFHGDFFVK